MKSALQIGFFAGLAASAITGWLSPSFITWYFNPPVEMSVSCKEAVAWGLDIYQKMTIGAALIVGVVTFFIVLIKQSQKPAAIKPTSPTQP